MQIMKNGVGGISLEGLTFAIFLEYYLNRL